ncbi:MAG: LacI family DNA-binding transcriptional regulator [Oliverpabstia sp.]
MTIYDIAKQAGVSASTVSRVINGKPGIKEATREKVQRLLEENSYTPNAAARGLVMQSSRFIGILIEDIRVSHHTDSVYVISQEMMASGYTCITLSTGTEPEQKAKYIEILEQRQVEGAILIGSMFSSDVVKESIKKHLSNIPVVLVNGTLDLPNVYSILINEEQGTQECVKYLLEQGRRNISYMMDVSTPSNQRKLQGFRNEMKLRGIPEERWQIVTAPGKNVSPNESIARGYEAAEQLLLQYPDTDAVLCATDLLAIGCLQYLRERNIQVPDRMAVMGVDNTLYGRLCTPTLSTLDNKLAELSQNAAHVLLDVFEGRATSRKIMLFTDLILREST